MELKVPMPWGFVAGTSYGAWGGSPLLALHTSHENGGAFAILGPLLPKDVNLVVVDLPGHGRSSHLPPGLPYHSLDVAAVVKRIAEHQKWKKFSLLGHGVGAELAILFAAAFPKMVEKVILIDGLRPSSVFSTGRAKALAAAIDEQVTNDAAYEENELHPPTFTYEEGLLQQMALSHGHLTHTTAKHILDRGIRRVAENEWAFTRDLRLSCPDTLTPSHEQAQSLMEALKGLPILFIKTRPGAEEDEALDRAAHAIYTRLAKPFLQVDLEATHHALLAHPQQLLTHILPFIVPPN